MELDWKRETIRFERLVTRLEEQLVVEGEAALPGSMRDAVTVLSVQAQAHIRDVQAGVDEVGVRGRVCFQVLYTQGDLTRVRALETTCDFERTVKAPGVAPGMRVGLQGAVQETEGAAGSGRMTLSALLLLTLEAFDLQEQTLITGGQEAPQLRTRQETVSFCLGEAMGQEKTLVREEFDLSPKLGVGDVLSASATANVEDLTGGSGRIGVTGVVEVRVLHQANEQGRPFVTTTHEVPYELIVQGQLPEDAQVRAQAEVVDVMADSVAGDRKRTLRIEAEVLVRLELCRRKNVQLLTDLYSLSGPQLEPQTQRLDIHMSEDVAEARESLRLQVALPADAPPMDTVLASFVQPVVASSVPAGRRLETEGVMGVTLIYLPVDSDIPYAVHVREPFAMTFPLEMGEGVSAQAYAIESSAGALTSDRAEVRCVLGLRAVRHGVAHITGIEAVEQREAPEPEHGFVLVWPAEGETRWDTARRLRVAEEALHPAGKRALLAFRR